MVVDSDMHVLEPGDLWSRKGLPIDGHEWMGLTIQGQRMPDVPAPWPREEDAAGFYRMLGPLHVAAAAKGFSPETAIEAMEREGIDVAVLFPTRAGWLVGADGLDPDLVARGCQVYNHWVAEYCASAPAKRLAAVALVSWADIPRAIGQAAYAVKELGLWGIVTRPNPQGGRTLDHPDLDVFYSAIEQLDVPLILHEGTGALTPTLGGDRALTRLAAHAMSHPFEQMAAVMHLTVGGVLARHPRLRVGFFEAGSWWLPGWLDRLDDHALGPFGAHEYTLERRPSFYFRRQAFVTCDAGEELYGIKEANLAGRVLFASDWPHGDGHHPYAVRECRTAARGLWPAISYTNALDFWRPA